ncbi:MAG: hypothetical protein J5942_01890, partial [Prevotella sp.]|nr:hypothetical protein [Prevotella sp.]
GYPSFLSDRRTKEHNTHPRPLPKGGEIEAYTSSDRKTKGHNTPLPSGGLGWASHHLLGRAGVGFSIIFSGGSGWVSLSCGYRAKNSKYQAENQQVPNGKAKQVVLVCNKGLIAMQ